MPPIKKAKVVPTLCRWHIYGCEYSYTTDKNHEVICSRRPTHAGADRPWRELVSHVLTDPNPVVDILAALGPWARDLTPVSVLSPNKRPIQDIPYYVDVSSWWSHGAPTPQTLEKWLLPSLKRQLGLDQCKLLIAQMDRDSAHNARDTVRVLNHASPRNLMKTMGLKLPDWVKLPIDHCVWNITPKKAFTDLHTDRGLDTITFQVGGRKIWLLYEPDPAPTSSNKVEQREAMFFNLWAQHFEDATLPPGASANDSGTFLEIAGPRLRRGYIAVTEGNQALFVPAGWKHAVFTLESGYLAGWSFGTNEHLKQQIQTILGELEAAVAFRKPDQYGPKTDNLLPDLWQDLNKSLSYVLHQITEIWEPHNTQHMLTAEELWPKLIISLNRLPALKAKNGPAIRSYNKLISQRKRQ
jgi:hypothetical protein